VISAIFHTGLLDPPASINSASPQSVLSICAIVLVGTHRLTGFFLPGDVVLSFQPSIHARRLLQIQRAELLDFAPDGDPEGCQRPGGGDGDPSTRGVLPSPDATPHQDCCSVSGIHSYLP
jgi:hypothetical protein